MCTCLTLRNGNSKTCTALVQYTISVIRESEYVCLGSKCELHVTVRTLFAGSNQPQLTTWPERDYLPLTHMHIRLHTRENEHFNFCASVVTVESAFACRTLKTGDEFNVEMDPESEYGWLLFSARHCCVFTVGVLFLEALKTKDIERRSEWASVSWLIRFELCTDSRFCMTCCATPCGWRVAWISFQLGLFLAVSTVHPHFPCFSRFRNPFNTLLCLWCVEYCGCPLAAAT